MVIRTFFFKQTTLFYLIKYICRFLSGHYTALFHIQSTLRNLCHFKKVRFTYICAVENEIINSICGSLNYIYFVYINNLKN